ncbi:glycosyltransferase family 4 protein [Undibacterium sp. Jales W-56]|uniref:glycosyltransferase family 4 protein n=1 Tax=Undibacterium sp. Jales W-56 TaxID=2897325 RepID=UPI0021CDF6FB|nr:glycosyltransferase family 4 protein [Undibacterium sp. Jales W-56]MCU6433909.1 glycosyltransferase family 4 protein [Undibacterium sp. Jales W-56]
MHILFLTDNFPPEVNAPASRTFEHCREWVAQGAKVTVITCAPNFPKGEVFDGYRNALWQRETVGGIEVIRVWSYITANEGFIKRILDYVSFMITATFAALFVRKVDVVIGTSPQFFTACAAWMTGVLKRRPWVFELRDIWPESIKAVGAMKESLAIRLLERIEMFLYRHASRIVAVTHSFKETLIRRGIDGAKIEVVTNGVDLTNFTPQPKDVELTQRLGLGGCFVAGYIGTHGMAHGLETLLDAAETLQGMPEAANVRLIFLGHGAKKAELIANSEVRGLRNVLFLDSVPKTEVARYWSLLDVSIIHLRKTELFGSVIPSKLFECMGMGIPVLHGVQGESAEIVRREGVGEVFESENASKLVDSLMRLRTDPNRFDLYRQNGLIAAKHYDRTSLARAMLKTLKHLVRR